MMRARYAANSFFYLNAMWTLVTSCLEPLNSATDGPAEHLKIGEWSSCCVIDSGRMLFVPRLRGDGCHLNHDRWYEIVVFGERSLTLCGFFVVFGLWRKRIDCSCLRWSVTVGVYAAAKFMGAAEEFMGDHREIHGSWFFWSRSRTACIVVLWNIDQKGLWRARARRPDVWAKMSPFVSGVYTMLILWSFRNQFYWMFCVWSSSIFDKAQWECETLENLVRVLQVHYENGLCTPPLVG